MEIEARIAEHLEPARRELRRQRLFVQHLDDVEVDVHSPDRSVKITQTCGGEVVKVEIAPGTFDRLNERTFAEVLTKTLKAGRQTGFQVARQLADEELSQRPGGARG